MDGIRGLAILLIMGYHFVLYGGIEPDRLLDRLPTKIGLSGWIGVDLFFVLSGFLITGILADTKQSNRYFRNFHMRRVLRIFPLYFGTLGLFFILIPWLFSISAEYEEFLQKQVWYWTYLSNYSISSDGWPPFIPGIGHFWSLAIEEQFYLIWPLVVFLLPRRTLLKACVAVVVASLFLRILLAVNGNGLTAYLITPARIDTLAVGAFLALAVRGSVRDQARLARYAAPVAGICGILILVYSIWKGRFAYGDVAVYTLGFTLIGFLFGAVLIISIAVPPKSLLGRSFCNPVLRFFGRYSYALYVVHQPVVLYLVALGFSVQTFPSIMYSQLPGLLLFSLVAATVSVVLALISWNFLESRFLALKPYFAYDGDGQANRGSEEFEAAEAAN